MTEKVIHYPSKRTREYITIDGEQYRNTAYVENPDDVRVSGDKKKMIKKGENLDKLLYDDDSDIRCALANKGYRRDILMYDVDKYVRRAVAHSGYRPDILIHDTDPVVRRYVAEQGYGFDTLVDDNDWEIRLVITKQGYKPEVMIRDDHWLVREKALEFIDDDDILDQVEKDENDNVRLKLLELHPERADHFKDDPYFKIRKKVAWETQDINILLDYLDEDRISLYHGIGVDEDVVDVAVYRIQHDFGGFDQFRQ